MEDHQRMVDLLRYQVVKGWHYFCIAHILYREYYQRGKQQSELFMSGSAGACRDMTLLICSRLFDNQDNLSLKGLERELRLGLPSFDPPVQRLIEHDLELLADLLKETNSLSTHIRTVRNSRIAHLSIDYVKHPSTFDSEPPMKMTEVQKFYRAAFELLNSIAVHLGMDSKQMDDITEATERDVQDVLSKL
jgi:hypothetical protein